MSNSHTVDVVIVGSGNGAMTAALCLYEMGIKDILLVEKTHQVGGCSSLGGGGIWIPNNHYAKAYGVSDSFDDAYQYLKATTPDQLGVPDEMITGYLKQAPKMLKFISERSQVQYESLSQYPDYFSDAPGARTGHRSLEPSPVDINHLDCQGVTLRRTHPMMYFMNEISMSQKEAHTLSGLHKGWVTLGAKLVLSYLLDLPQRLKTKRSRRAACGSAGVARLALSLQDRKIPVWLNTEMSDLIIEEGRTTGITVKRSGKTMDIHATKAVVLASGGFEHNQTMREQHLPAPTQKSWSASNPANTGLPIEAAINAGAAVRGMHEAWWCTTYKVPGKELPFLSIMEKSYPGNCVVNRNGQRLANESMNYQMYVQACFEAKKNGKPVDDLWMVFDARFRANYLIGPLMTSKLMPDALLPKSYFCNEFLSKADSIEELSAITGIDQTGLKNTIANMNRYAQTGNDDEFNRGGFAYDRYYGDPDVKPNPCLAPIDQGPFYAIRLYLGEFGTNGGLVINPDGQVLHNNGKPLQGLYATGNCTAATLPTYPGPGSTLGPAMTFAYQAAKHISDFDDSAVTVP